MQTLILKDRLLILPEIVNEVTSGKNLSFSLENVKFTIYSFNTLHMLVNISTLELSDPLRKAFELVSNGKHLGSAGQWLKAKLLQYNYLKEEAAARGGAHLNFETYGKLNSWVWRENIPVPDGIPGIIKCDVAFGNFLSGLVL